MVSLIPNIDEKYFGSFSREGLKIVRFMADKWPKKRTFTNEEIGRIIKSKGKSLGGILGAFSKRDGFSIVTKVGMISTNWSGEKLSRPKQVWALNPRLKKEDVYKIKEILDNFLLNS